MPKYERYNWITHNVAVGGFLDVNSDHVLQMEIQKLWDTFDIIVFCVEDIYPDRPCSPDRAIKCCYEDAPGQDLTTQIEVAERLAALTDEKILFSCHGGFNRSAFMAAICLIKRHSLRSHTVVDLIRCMRPNMQTLSNIDFVKQISDYVPVNDRKRII